MVKRNKELLTPELLTALIAIAVAVTALWLVLENKPLLAGYKEVDCRVVQYEDGSSICTVKLDTPNQQLRVFKAAR